MRPRLRAALATLCLAGSAWAVPAARTVPLPGFSCRQPPYGLKLPQRIHELQALGALQDEFNERTERVHGLTIRHNAMLFDGLSLRVTLADGDEGRFDLEHAAVSDARWNRLSPFKLGDSEAHVRRLLGVAAIREAALDAAYGGPAGSVTFGWAGGRLTSVSYRCAPMPR